jgi:hypothetical protein
MEKINKILGVRKVGLPGEKMQEMREDIADHTCKNAHNFITGKAKQFKKGY